MLDAAHLPQHRGAPHLWGATGIPRKVYQVLYPLKRHFRCAQAQHFLVCCWLVMALMRAPGRGTLKGLPPSLPPTLKYRTTMRMIRAGPGDAAAVVCDLATATLRALPPPADGIWYLIGDSTLKEKRGRQQPLGHTIRPGDHAPYALGFEIVLLIARGEQVRVPIALGLIEPTCRGHQNILFRQMLKAFGPPTSVQHVGVVADAGFAANETLRLLAKQH